MLVEITLTASSLPKQVFTTPAADGTPGKPSPMLSSAVKVGNRLYVAGLLGNNAETKGNTELQTKEIMARAERTMKLAGFGWNDVVDGIVYITDIKQLQRDEHRLPIGAHEGLPRPRHGEEPVSSGPTASSRSCSSPRSKAAAAGDYDGRRPPLSPRLKTRLHVQPCQPTLAAG